MKKFNNYILDFGGVLYEINHKATFDAFFLMTKYPDKFRNYDMKKYLNDELIIRFERGLLSSVDFRKQVMEKFSIDSNVELFDKAFNATLVSLKPDAIDNVRLLKSIGKVYLLSNTNEIHHNHFNNECKELFDLFNGLYFSHILGVRKPDAEIFKILLNRTGINPTETIFVDDSEANIAKAKGLGFETYQVDESHNLSDLIHNVKNVDNSI
jgi:putative hydrolase of the HAD superfamily